MRLFISMNIFLKKHNISREDVVLCVIAIVSVCVAVFSIMTVGRVSINSDTATPVLLLKSQNEAKSMFPDSWCYANGAVWFLSLETMLRPFMLVGSAVLARNLCSVMVVVLFSIGLILLDRDVFRNRSYLMVIFLVLIGMWGSSEHILYQGAYLWVITRMIFQIWLFCKICNSENGCILWYILLGILVCIRAVGGVRELGDNVVPMLGAALITLLFDLNREKLIFWIKRIIPIVTGAVIGFGVNQYIAQTHIVNNTDRNSMMMISSLNEIGDVVFIYIKNLFFSFGYNGGTSLISLAGLRNLCSVVMCVFFVIVIPSLQIRKLKEESEVFQLFFTYATLHCLIVIIMIMFCGEFEPRYVITVIFLSCVISCYYIKKYWIDKGFLGKNLFMFAFIIVSTIGIVGMIGDSNGWRDQYNAEMSFVSELRSHNLSKGYGDYWATYMLDVYSEGDIRTGAVSVSEEGITPHRWLVDEKVFVPDDINTFLMLEVEQNELIEENIEDFFGKPLEIFETKWCGYKPVVIYVFDHDIMGDKGIIEKKDI